ncbi:hypothetical protein L873DRAFT_1819151 [Choiromyces venosus 120613-1]|uniref:Uncharacterized protein n=1 Tax=Choiromyces venosus 120613-1 TaxID=1336337 RepID=A0A3N4J4T9_9PEZI|nr:hypothetical protein L873DRAFT_1819151 [Choiromyces venosus 120613-1]
MSGPGLRMQGGYPSRHRALRKAREAVYRLSQANGRGGLGVMEAREAEAPTHRASYHADNM